jgi:putative acetyltransferase
METLVEPIRHAARQLVRELHLLDQRHCIEGFTFSECHLLTELERLGQATAKQLSEILVLEKSTVSRLVNGLLERGLIASSRDPTDGRQRRLSLTAQGRAGTRRVHEAAREQVLGALAFIAPEQAGETAEGLQRYADGLKYLRLSAPFTLRPIETRDNPNVAGIIREVMTEFGAVGPDYSICDPEVDAMCEAFSPSGHTFYVIERGGEVLGGGGIAPLKGGDPATCELQKMYFRPELRGTGMGTRLLNVLLADARRMGYQQCYLETLDCMEAARRLYLKHGFQSIDSPMGCTGHSGCNAWMIKPL